MLKIMRFKLKIVLLIPKEKRIHQPLVLRLLKISAYKYCLDKTKIITLFLLFQF